MVEAVTKQWGGCGIGAGGFKTGADKGLMVCRGCMDLCKGSWAKENCGGVEGAGGRGGGVGTGGCLTGGSLLGSSTEGGGQ